LSVIAHYLFNFERFNQGHYWDFELIKLAKLAIRAFVRQYVSLAGFILYYASLMLKCFALAAFQELFSIL
jgi:hypothetical protein